ncbi:HlyD family type I secretion periplasmic adaptor subunit [Massilia sp. TWR1-2-2]|uniref:HlyD family type I secretion periplasmic adaptor subunit n=1 Tax=Massilia sp. TWR1-2-2 TaxID=2804584 RepID=UPI003CE9BC13
MKLIKKEPHSTEVTEVITHDVSPLVVSTDARSYSRLGWIIVIAGVCGFLLWAIFAPLDKGVPMSGTVASESSRKSVQHLTGGTIAEIHVKEGDTVKAGQVLVRMNDVLVKSQADSTLSQYYTARAAEARLLAERDGKSTIQFPPALEQERKDPRVAAVIALQSQLFSSRKLALQNELAAVNENIAGLKLQQRGIEESRDSKKEQLGMLKSQLEGMRDLAKDGYIARNRLLEVERSFSQINGAISEDFGNIGRIQRQVMELSLRRIQRTEEFQKEVRSQLVDTQREAEALEGRVTAQAFDLKNADVVAPVDGTVVGMQVFTRGGVVSPGFKLMDIVPAGDALVAEGQLPVNLIDKVHKGLPVEMIFSAFNANSTPHIPGQIISVSADRLIDDKTGMPYYKVRARVTPEGAKMAAKLDIRPGMPVEIFVNTGERSMMSYLLKPIFDRAKTSMTEE